VFLRDLLRMVWQNLGRMKVRVALTAIGVIIGTGAVVTLMSLGAGLHKSVVGEIASVSDLTQINVFPPSFVQAFSPVPGRKSRFRTLNKQAIDFLKSLPHVVAVTPQERLQGMATLRFKRKVAGANIVGLDPVEAKKLGWEVAKGSFRLGRNQAVIGARVGEMFSDPFRRKRAERLNLYGQTLFIELTRFEGEREAPVPSSGGRVIRVVRPSAQPRGSAKKIRVQVVGVLKPRGESDYTVYLSLDEVHKMNEWLLGQRIDPNRKGYESVLVKVESPDKVSEVEKRLEEAGLPAYSFKTMLDSLNRMFFVLQAIVGSIGGIALLVAAFGIANTMTMAIYERTREIGLMKALGATNRDIMSIFLAEAGAIGFIGGVIGTALGAGISQLISLMIVNYVKQRGGEALPSYAHTPLWLLFLGIAFSTCVGIISGVYPALRAASLAPVQALKYE